MTAKINTRASIAKTHQKLVTDHPMVILVISSDDGRILDANLAAARYYGWSIEQLRQMNIREINTLSPEEVQAEMELARTLQRNYFSFRHKLADGRVREVEVYSMPLVWDRQNVLCSMISDVTERRLSEQAVQESETKYRLLFEMESDALFLIDSLSGNLLDANLAAVALYGYSREELLGMRHVDLSAEPDETKKASISAGSSGTVEIPLRYHRKKDGTVFPVEIKSTSLLWKGRQAVMPAIRDITDRRLAEEAVRKSGERFQKLLKSLPLPMSIVNKEGNLVYINDQFTRVFGYTSEDIPTLAEWKRVTYLDDNYLQRGLETWETKIGQAMKGNEIEAKPAEIMMKCKNGTVLDVLVSANIDEEEIVITFTDITEQRRNERLLHVAYERRRKNELFKELVKESLPSEPVLHEISRMIGNRIIEPISCYLIVIDNWREMTRAAERERLNEYHILVDSIIDVLDDVGRIAWETPEGIGVICFGLVPCDGIVGEQKKLAEQLRQIIARQAPDLAISIGIAEISADISELGSRYRQAVMAVDTGSKVWPQWKTYHLLDLGIFQLLPYMNEQAPIDSFIERTLGKLLHYDNKKNVDFFPTLETLLLTENLKDSADKLSIHYQTLMFRRRRLEEILGISFDDSAARMSILIALSLWKLKK